MLHGGDDSYDPDQSRGYARQFARQGRRSFQRYAQYGMRGNGLVSRLISLMQTVIQNRHADAELRSVLLAVGRGYGDAERPHRMAVHHLNGAPPCSAVAATVVRSLRQSRDPPTDLCSLRRCVDELHSSSGDTYICMNPTSPSLLRRSSCPSSQAIWPSSSCTMVANRSRVPISPAS